MQAMMQMVKIDISGLQRAYGAKQQTWRYSNMTKSATAKNGKAPESIAEGADAITQYNAELSPEHAAICNALRREIDATLPAPTCKIWYANPVWFVGENPVVGYHINAKKVVNLLFWSGQLFDEPALKAAGKFKAAQIQFKHESEIDWKALRGWLKKSATRIWDYNGMRNGKLGK